MRTPVALVPSPLPPDAAARERMLADLRAAALQVRPNAPEIPDGGARRLLILDPGPSSTPVAEHLSDPPPVDVMIELGTGTPTERVARWAHRIAETDVFWSLSTSSAMRMATPSHALAQAVVGALGGRASQDLLMRVETALHETFANALVHGNLGLPSLCELEGDAGHMDYDDAVAERLSDGARAHRRVEVSAFCETDCLRIRVSDEGDGLPLENWNQSLAGGEYALTHADKSGRGLYLTAMFCDELNRDDDGRTIELCFQPEMAV